MLQLSDKFVQALVTERETGMGFQTADVSLKDGQIFKKVTIINSEFIAAIHGRSDIPFSEPDIDKIVVTHEKWTP